jgi:UDP-N-acetyl-D-glucosamine dehydrogenase
MRRNVRAKDGAAPGAAAGSGTTSAPTDPLSSTDRLIAVVGLGYVGLPTALGFRDGGAQIIGIDINPERIDLIRLGQADLSPSDRWRLTGALHDEQFVLTSDGGLLSAADAVVICVPTPVDRHLTPDLAPLRTACRTVVGHARAGQLIVLTSTTFVGATQELLVAPVEDRGFTVGADVHIAFSPERIDPGRPDHASASTPRVVGGATDACTRRASGLLSRLTEAGLHAVRSPEVAEMVKLHENAFRAVNLALANEMAEVCRAFRLDPTEVIDAAATKPYGYLAHRPGPGVGGHCIPCDPHYLLWQLRERRVSAPVTEHAMAAIAARPGKVTARVVETLSSTGRGLRGANVIVVGVTYKSGVADLRSSPAIEIIEHLLGKGANVHYWDPLVPILPLTDRVLTSEPDPCGEDYDLALVHTVQPQGSHEWVLRCPTILDATYSFTDAAHRDVV